MVPAVALSSSGRVRSRALVPSARTGPRPSRRSPSLDKPSTPWDSTGGVDVCSSCAARGRRIVRQMILPYALGSEVEHQGSLQLSTVFQLGRRLKQVSHCDCVQVDHGGPRARGERHQQGIEVGLVAVSGDHHGLRDTVVLPACQQLVHRPVQGLAAKPAGPGVAARCRRWSHRRRRPALVGYRAPPRPAASPPRPRGCWCRVAGAGRAARAPPPGTAGGSPARAGGPLRAPGEGVQGI